MELDFVILADGVVMRPDGKIDILGAAFDTIFAPAVPARHPRLTIALRFLLSSHETEHPHSVDVIVQAPDGAEVARAHAEGGPLTDEQRAEILPGRHAALPLILGFEDIVFQEYGAHQIVIQWDGTEIREPLRLFLQPPPQ